MPTICRLRSVRRRRSQMSPVADKRSAKAACESDVAWPHSYIYIQINRASPAPAPRCRRPRKFCWANPPLSELTSVRPGVVSPSRGRDLEAKLNASLTRRYQAILQIEPWCVSTAQRRKAKSRFPCHLDAVLTCCAPPCRVLISICIQGTRAD